MSSMESFLEAIYNKYNKNPQGWNVIVSKDEKGYPTVLFFSEDEVWELKMDSMYKPNPIWVGKSFKNEEKNRKLENPSYGFRGLENDQASRLLKAMAREDAAKEIIRSVLENEPKPLEEIKDRKMVLHGPIINSPKIPVISQQQVDLDIKLRIELQKLLLNRGIGSMYG
ncbi:MAG: hypothetical protein ABSB40_01240 [Nitrososphaeria archaeon]